MADGLCCTAVTASNVRKNDENTVRGCDNAAADNSPINDVDGVNVSARENLVRSLRVPCKDDVDDDDDSNNRSSNASGEMLFDKLCAAVVKSKGESPDVVVVVEDVMDTAARMPSCALTDEDCRKKRCVDRYDSSESSDRLVLLVYISDIFIRINAGLSI
ncbi:hypothetical protein QE152_g1952 [Popillia japonica]|uniref:Uncharacterized protein n=1 Tax=Popillia japonica TaxID=7064 RepID=A0AAW1N2X6_POPJA